MKTFKHNLQTGQCIFLDIPTIKNDVDALYLAEKFLVDINARIQGRLGIAKLNPKDKHYVKSIGREVSEKNAKDSTFEVVSLRKLGPDNMTKITLKTSDNDFFELYVKRGSRVRIEL